MGGRQWQSARRLRIASRNFPSSDAPAGENQPLGENFIATPFMQ